MFLLFLLLGTCSAVRIEQSINEEHISFIHIEISKSYDSKILELDGVCENFTSSEFYKIHDNPTCTETEVTITLEGYREIGPTQGFTEEFEFVESVYEFNSPKNFGGLISGESMFWGAVPFKEDSEALRSYRAFMPYLVEMPGEVWVVRNGEKYGARAKFDLVDLFLKNRGVYVESRQTNWKFFSSLIIFLIMMVGILVVWMSYFYLKGKT